MAKEPCASCRSTLYHTTLVRYPDGPKGVKIETCSECERLSMRSTYDDVYFRSNGRTQTDPNLCDPKTGREIPFSSKAQKAAVMKQLGLRQAKSAEREHGYRNEMYLHRKTYFT